MVGALIRGWLWEWGRASMARSAAGLGVMTSRRRIWGIVCPDSGRDVWVETVHGSHPLLDVSMYNRCPNKQRVLTDMINRLSGLISTHIQRGSIPVSARHYWQVCSRSVVPIRLVAGVVMRVSTGC